MDLLDFLKCHLCEEASHLFLLVPRALRQNPGRVVRAEYARVVRRIGTFFVPRNYANVPSAHIYGY